jgi:hypothetical protein
VTLGVSFCFTNSAAWAICVDTVIDAPETMTRTNSSSGCSFTVTGNGSISTAVGSAVINQSQRNITTFSNSGTISALELVTNAYGAINNSGSVFF